jgi:hypothetical protein
MWINNPRRLWEGRGMTGMEVLVTGGLKLYELDGGWAEAYPSEVGRAGVAAVSTVMTWRGMPSNPGLPQRP